MHRTGMRCHVLRQVFLNQCSELIRNLLRTLHNKEAGLVTISVRQISGGDSYESHRSYNVRRNIVEMPVPEYNTELHVIVRLEQAGDGDK